MAFLRKAFPQNPTESIQTMPPLIQSQENQQVPPESWRSSRSHSRRISCQLTPWRLPHPWAWGPLTSGCHPSPATWKHPDEIRGDNAGVCVPNSKRSRALSFTQPVAEGGRKGWVQTKLNRENHHSKCLPATLVLSGGKLPGDGERGTSRTERCCFRLLNLWTTAPSVGKCGYARIPERIPCCSCPFPGGTSASPQSWGPPHWDSSQPLTRGCPHRARH